jgi:SagB-type dehydrogenase family enzyme
MSHKISQDIFFLIEKNQVLLWDCSKHEQYLLDKEHFETLLYPDRKEGSSAFKNLESAGILKKKPIESEAWGWDTLSKLFHTGTKNIPTDPLTAEPETHAQNYLSECEKIKTKAPHLFQEKKAPIVDLPTPNLSALNTPLNTTFLNRKTSRSFNSSCITLQQLSDLLYGAFGLIHGDWNKTITPDIHVAGIRKASPSSGGLHSEEAYVVIYRVTGLESGLYYYRPQDHKLNILKKGFFEDEVIEYNNHQFYSKGLAAGLYISSRLDKYWWKYQHSRCYRIMLLDIGHVSQTLLLTATALGLHTWMTGAFKDSEIETFLGIDGFKESVMMFVGVGLGENSSFPPNYLL